VITNDFSYVQPQVGLEVLSATTFLNPSLAAVVVVYHQVLVAHHPERVVEVE